MSPASTASSTESFPPVVFRILRDSKCAECSDEMRTGRFPPGNQAYAVCATSTPETLASTPRKYGHVSRRHGRDGATRPHCPASNRNSSAVVYQVTPASSKSLSFDHTGSFIRIARASSSTSSGSRSAIRFRASGSDAE